MSNNGYNVDRSAALAELQSNYGMSASIRVPRVPDFARPAAAPTTNNSHDDEAVSFVTSSPSSSSSASSLSSIHSTSSLASLKAKAAGLFKLNGSSNKSLNSTVQPKPEPASTHKPDPALVFAHLSSHYGVGTSFASGFKLPNLEQREQHSTKAARKQAKREAATKCPKQSHPAPAEGSPEAALAMLMDMYGAPGRSQLRSFT